MNGGPGELGGMPQQQQASGGGGGPSAGTGRVSGPAIGLMITAGLGMAANVMGILSHLLGMGMGALGGFEHDQFPALQMLQGPIGIVLNFIGIGMGIVVLLGAIKMKNLESYSFAMIATIIAMIPCLSPCCCLGVPIGIWSLIVLLDSNVKAAFRS